MRFGLYLFVAESSKASPAAAAAAAALHKATWHVRVCVCVWMEWRRGEAVDIQRRRRRKEKMEERLFGTPGRIKHS